MINVPVTSEMSIDFIIYNIIQAKQGGFTISELLEEIKVYDATITEPILSRKIEELVVKQNTVRQKFNEYYINKNG